MSKKRTENFTREEESQLVLLAQKYASVIECKKTDSDANSKKRYIWCRIADEFNSQLGKCRTHIVLKNKYQNLKKKRKIIFAEEKRHAMAIGGGPAQEIAIIDIKHLLDNQITDGNVTEFDDDCFKKEDVPLNSSGNNSENEISRIFIKAESLSSEDEIPAAKRLHREDANCETCTATPSSVTNNMSSCCLRLNYNEDQLDREKVELENNLAKSLSTPLAQNTKFTTGKSKSEISSQISNGAKSKVHNANVQSEILWAEYENRKLQREEKHKQDLKFAQEEHFLKMQYLKEEHEIKIKLLKKKFENS